MPPSAVRSSSARIGDAVSDDLMEAGRRFAAQAFSPSIVKLSGFEQPSIDAIFVPARVVSEADRLAARLSQAEATASS